MEVITLGKEKMMQITGIIAEYNPFHNGHKYHVVQARERTKADIVVAVMSGNYVQRGELAVLDKWTRAYEAINNGLDVIFELPFSATVQPGHIFAKQAINLLYEAGVNSVVCGAEHPEYNFIELAKQPIDNHQAFKQYKNTYATTYYDQLKEITGIQISAPNDILALSYAQAIVDGGWEEKIKLVPIKRIAAGYHDTTLLPNQAIASASAIRKNELLAVEKYVPKQTFIDLKNNNGKTNFSDTWWPYLRYQLESTSIKELQNIYQVSEGLEYKIKKALENSNSYDEFMQKLKSKRYTTPRLQRMLLYIVLNITSLEMELAWSQPFLNLLATNQAGQDWLKVMKKEIKIPLYSKIGSSQRTTAFALQFKVDRLYSLLSQKEEQNIGRIPWHT